MDSKFLAFWADVFQAAARNRKVLEDYARWMEEGAAGSEAIVDLFKRAYGLKSETAATRPDPTPTPFDQALESFRKSMGDYFALLGMAPQQEYPALKKKCEALEEKVRKQEETIAELKLLLENRQTGLEGVRTGFERLFEIQSRQYGELIESLGFRSEGETDEGDKG